MTSEEVLRAAGAIAADVAPRAEEIEAARRLPPDLASAMASVGLFKVCVPVAYGGSEVDPVSLLRGSAATLDGGAAYLVDGRWPFGSGAQHCTWLMGSCVVDGGPDVRLALFPAEDVEVIDTWIVTGLRGTGSHDFAVHELRVPGACVVRLADPPVDLGPLYRMPLFGLLAAGVAAVGLGIGAAAVLAFADLAGAKVATGHRRRLADRPTVQADIAKAVADLRSAREYLRAAIARGWDSAVRGDVPSADLRADMRLAATRAAAAGAGAATVAYTLAGGTSVYADHPLQRHFRDAHVVTQHMTVGPATWETAGRVLLGGEAAPEL
jgi:indole-3-acetate monooxygenase